MISTPLAYQVSELRASNRHSKGSQGLEDFQIQDATRSRFLPSCPMRTRRCISKATSSGRASLVGVPEKAFSANPRWKSILEGAQLAYTVGVAISVARTF
jgi:hypothetical protein